MTPKYDPDSYQNCVDDDNDHFIHRRDGTSTSPLPPPELRLNAMVTSSGSSSWTLSGDSLAVYVELQHAALAIVNDTSTLTDRSHSSPNASRIQIWQSRRSGV